MMALTNNKKKTVLSASLFSILLNIINAKVWKREWIFVGGYNFFFTLLGRSRRPQLVIYKLIFLLLKC